MNEFACSEHSVRIRRSKKCSTGNQPLGSFRSDYQILTLEICNYKLVVVLTLTQYISKTTVEAKRGRLWHKLLPVKLRALIG